MKTTCEFCHSNNCDFYELPFGFYDHVKFKKLKASNGKLAVCSDCGAVGNVCDESLHQSIATRFRGNEYFATKKTDFHLSVPEFDGMVSPYFLLARAISQVLGKFHPRVLDIGCLDGKLLLERGADGFVDENPAKLSGPFLGKPVIHPKDMTANDVVLLPYGNGNAIIAEKFQSAYSARVIDY